MTFLSSKFLCYVQSYTFCKTISWNLTTIISSNRPLFKEDLLSAIIMEIFRETFTELTKCIVFLKSCLEYLNVIASVLSFANC